MRTIAIIASYGLEIAEVGGTLATHHGAGDDVRAAVLLARAESRAPISAAAGHLGIDEVEFLEARHGELDGTEGRALRDRAVAWLRSTRPDVLLMPDPEHAVADLDPDRRHASILVLEAASLCSRDWREDELGAPAPTPELYFFAAERPTCVVDVSASFDRKLAALGELAYQADYSAQVLRQRVGDEPFAHVMALAADAGLLEALETARAVTHGAGGHSRAALAEAFRHPGTITLDRLV